jgi:hypothetical protein
MKIIPIILKSDSVIKIAVRVKSIFSNAFYLNNILFLIFL